MGVGDALGSFVTRLRGGERGESGAAEKHAAVKVKNKRQNVKRIALFNLIGILKILANEVRNINSGMCFQDAKEVIGCDDLTVALIIVILNESKESLITDAPAQVFKKMRATEVDRVGVWAKSLTVINGRIYKALWVVKVNAI